MSEHDSEKQRPSHRVSFARLNGRDKDGNDVLGPAREIGSVWPRRGKEGEGILRFDHIPEELRSRNGGVLFIKTVEKGQERQTKPDRPARKERGLDRDSERER